MSNAPSNAELIKKNYVSAWPVFQYIEKEWFDNAISEGVIKFHSKQYGYQIACIEREEVEVVGHRGRTPITEKKLKLDCSKWFNFLNRYQTYREQKEGQEYAVNQEMTSLIHDSKGVIKLRE